MTTVSTTRGVTVARGNAGGPNRFVLGLFVATRCSVASSPLRALVIAGLVYPIAFDVVGGALAGLYRRATADSRGKATV